jgi:broad specificity phosphatase PhoE/predicted kinase
MLAIVMVGLPARGKTYTARKIVRYLSWRGVKTKVFNVGTFRRKISGANVPHTFFDPSNEQGQQARKKAAKDAMDSMLDFFKQGGQVGVYDATNSTKKRRGWAQKVLEGEGIDVAFLESLCTDEELVEANIIDHKINSPDYEHATTEQAISDFRARINHYHSVYETLEEEEGSWIKLVDGGKKVIVHEMHSYLETRIATFVMNLHLRPKTLYFSRHGQSLYNVENRVGGDSALSSEGRLYAESLKKFVMSHIEDCDHIKIWTSTLQRTKETAKPLGRVPKEWKSLDEINAGLCDGLTYEEIRQKYPEIASARQADKLRYRYPQGESYEDVIERLDPIIFELERSKKSVLLIAHQAILRALYAYFANRPLWDVPYLSIPLHTVIQLTPETYGCVEMRHALPPQLDE